MLKKAAAVLGLSMLAQAAGAHPSDSSVFAALNPKMKLLSVFAEYGVFDDPGFVPVRPVIADQRAVPATQAASGEQGRARAYLELAARHERAGAREGAERTFTLYQQAALRGDGYAQEKLAKMYEMGSGVAKDPAMAYKWYSQAAHQGMPLAQAALVMCYGTGTGVAQDLAKAYVWSLIVLENPGFPQSGHAHVERVRDWLEPQLTRAQIERARGNAQHWRVGRVLPEE